jgi:hypothetical protein
MRWNATLSLFHLFLSSLTISITNAPAANAMVPQSFIYRNALSPTTLRDSSMHPCLFTSKTRGGDIIIRMRSSQKTQQVYIGISLAILLLPSVAYPVMQIGAAVVAASILNLIQGNGLVIIKRRF